MVHRINTLAQTARALAEGIAAEVERPDDGEGLSYAACVRIGINARHGRLQLEKVEALVRGRLEREEASA